MSDIVKLTKRGEARVLDGKAGMVFEVLSGEPNKAGGVVHVLDRRFETDDQTGQVWSLRGDDYEPLRDLPAEAERARADVLDANDLADRDRAGVEAERARA